MTRVPLDLAATIAGVKPCTIRKWVERGKVVRYSDGYDVAELLLWIDQRSAAALYVRFGLKREDWPDTPTSGA